MNSLSTGVWGSFITPCSRALGGKSGMTRAAPLVCFAQPAPLHFADCLHMLFLVLLSAFLWFANLPPDGRPQLFPITLEHACPEQPTNLVTNPITLIEQELCATAVVRSHAEARGARARDSGEARTRERGSGSVQNDGASEARAGALTSL
ncbi:hypothetical protein [Pseudomonas sp. OTU750018]|uniref:hypothetical protein n=1 Tax=Pseudomonas sp. OTU750018 TaxID=2709708 RepID=UPI00159E3D65|nr:hypothetical protein [Pseudomonas sp. OTU750018]